MMGLDERLFYLIVGCIIGFIIGWFSRSIHNIEEKVTEVDDIIKKDHDEAGFIRLPSRSAVKGWFAKLTWKGVALFIVVVLTALSSFQSQKVSNDVRSNSEQDRKTQERISRITTCNSQFLGRTILALNERTEFSTDQARANVALQKEQLRLLTIALTIPPPNAADGQAAVDRYLSKLNRYVELATKTAQKTATTKYPTLDDFTNCVENNKELIL
jgi:hypothetical protein